MKLFYSPGACALASQIALREAGLPFEMVKVDLKEKKFADGSDFKAVNPKGYVPALQLQNGQLMTEGSVILQWIADQAQDKNLIPKFGTSERYKAMEWLNFIATELHKGFSPLFGQATMSEESIKFTHGKIQTRLAHLNSHLLDNEYMLGKQFSVVDAYLYNILRWSGHLKIDLANYPAVIGHMEKMKARPSVQEAVAAEGIRL